ncbi:hypothetical protein ABW21_db0205656 [Orbilia brochopaga]|nr:hypothetical protein ABW21_db0205656 [Drechslerella brochopaga]
MHSRPFFQSSLAIGLGIVASVSASQIQQQYPLLGSTSPANAFQNDAQPGCTEVGSPILTCLMDAGYGINMEMGKAVYNPETGDLLCAQALQDVTSPPAISQPELIFGSSSYDLTTGVMSAATLPTSNQFSFVGRYAGSMEIVQVGYACEGLVDQPVTATVTMGFSAATAVAGVAACAATAPVISNNSYLGWGKKDVEPCAISFSVDSDLYNEANFGAVQLDYSDIYYLVINGSQYALRTPATPPVLVASMTGKIVKAKKKIPAGTDGTLKYIHSQGIDLGTGCWRVNDGSANGTYESVGFLVNYQSFVMQDWDQGSGSRVQLPLGGPNSVITWTLGAQADLQNGTWTVNDAETKFVPPVPTSVPVIWPAGWNDWEQRPARITGVLGTDGCYVLTSNPLPST